MPYRIRHGGITGNRLLGKTVILAAPSGGLEPAVIPMSQAVVAQQIQLSAGAALLEGHAPDVAMTDNVEIAVPEASMVFEPLTPRIPGPITFRCGGL